MINFSSQVNILYNFSKRTGKLGIMAGIDGRPDFELYTNKKFKDKVIDCEYGEFGDVYYNFATDFDETELIERFQETNMAAELSIDKEVFEKNFPIIEEFYNLAEY